MGTSTVRGMNSTIDPIGRPLLVRRELLAAGHSPAEIEQAKASDWMRPLRRGVYSPTASWLALAPVEQHVLRARAAARAAPSVVVSHISAAALHGLPISRHDLDLVHVTRPGQTGARRDDRRVLHVAPLDPSEIIEIEGVRTTSLVRTLVDVARTASFEAAVTVADAGLHRSPLIVGAIAETLATVRGRAGAAAARRALHFADGRAESPGESRLRIAVNALGLPNPQLQCRVYGRQNEFLARTDFGFLLHGLLMEFDGKSKYRDPEMTQGRDMVDVLLDEAAREKRLWELGWHVIRVVWAELFDLPQLERRIRALLARGGKVLETLGIAGSVKPLDPIRVPR